MNLLIASSTGKPLSGSSGDFMRNGWRPAVATAGLQPGRKNGLHALRHWFASAVLDVGESIKTVSTDLGHSNPGFTLRTYIHLMPNTEDRMRRVIDQALDPDRPHDGPDTAQQTG